MSKHVVFISLPMSGISYEVVKENIEKAKKAYLILTGRNIEEVAFRDNLDAGNYFKNELKHENVWLLGHALHKLASCDEAFFWFGWRRARGCMVEHEVCTLYDIPTISVEKSYDG